MIAAGAPRKVRLTLYSDADYFGGAEGYLALLAGHLDRELFALSAVLPAGAGTLESCLRRAGAEVYHLGRPGFRWLPLLPEMIRTFHRCGGEVLHMNLPSSYDAGVSSVAWAARQAGYRRVVSTEHLPMIERKYRKFPTKLFFSHWVDEVITVAEANRRYLTGHHGIPGEKIRVIPNGVEEPGPLPPAERTELRRSWGAGPEAAVIGITGRLTRRKGHHRLLAALRRLADVPGWRLVVVGEGEEDAALRRQAAESGLDRRIAWLGYREDAPRLMRGFDLFVLPSTVEAMPLTILEAMAAGVPCVASSIYGIPEIVAHGESGLLVPPRDEEALARALLDLVRSEEARARMGSAARRRYEERFTAERMAQDTAAAYLDGSPGARTLHAA